MSQQNEMTQLVVPVTGQTAIVPTVLGQKSVQLPIGGTIRPGIKILTREAEKHSKAREIYEAGKQLGKSFDKISADITAAVPALQNPLRPTNVPYFSVRAGDFPMPEVAALLLSKYGEDRGDGVVRLYRFPVIFAVDSWDCVMPHTLKCYAGAKLKYWAEYEADGETRRCMMHAPVPRDPKTQRVIRLFGGRKTVPRPENDGLCEPENCPEYQNRQCNLDGKLLFIVPGIPSINLIALPTRSFYSMDDIRKKLAHVAAMRGGRISGYLLGTQTFWLTKVYKDVARIDDEGNATKGPQWLINLEADVDLGGLLLAQNAQTVARTANQAMQVLEGSTTIDGGDNRAIDRPTLPPAAAAEIDERMRIKQLRVDVAQALNEVGIAPDRFDRYSKTTWGKEDWGRTIDGLFQALAHIKAIREPRATLKLLLQELEISADRYDCYAQRRFRRDDWSLTVDGIQKALTELDEFTGNPGQLSTLIDNELDLI
ncbi:MAG: hypothetical protein V4568_10600 [Pseudomonadota bacterium]